jgi:hypothetical protein
VNALEAEEQIEHGKDIVTWILRNRFRKLVLSLNGLTCESCTRIMMPEAWLVVLLINLDEAVTVFESTLPPSTSYMDMFAFLSSRTSSSSSIET